MALVFLLSATGQAGDHWQSGARTESNTPITNVEDLERVARQGGTTVFDVVISLHSDPTTETEREPYEEIIQYFADGVYESTNGAHKLGTVTFYTRGRFSDRADVVWGQLGHPRATVGGYGRSSFGRIIRDRLGSIKMYDVFDDGAGPGNDYDLLGDTEGAGYTLAHEWGHYTYALLDEYIDEELGTEAIMNSQWRARGWSGNRDLLRALNFSNDVSYGENPPDTRQFALYGASAWETLRRPTIFDLRRIFDTRIRRIFFSDLAPVAPARGSFPGFELPGTARSELDIRWQEDDLAIQIVIDNSGSMGSDNKMANARLAAQFLVDQVPLDSTTLGVIRFSSDASVVSPLQLIDEESDRDSIKAQIATITADGLTNIAAGASLALDNMLADSTIESANKVVFLLTDGQDSGGTSVIPAFQAANVPIIAFAYGGDADIPTLTQLANETRGQLYISPTQVGQIAQAFSDALLAVSSLTGVAGGSGTAVPGAPSSTPFTVDSTIESLDSSVSYIGAQADAVVELIAPSGAIFTPTDCQESAGQTLCTFSVPADQNEVGEWLVVVSAVGPNDVTYDYSVTGAPTDGGTFTLNAESWRGSEIPYPEPFVVSAKLARTLAVNGATVMAEVESPSGALSTIELLDDGAAPDELADDGIYTALVDYEEGGTWNLSIVAQASGGVASFTQNGLSDTSTIDGRPAGNVGDEPIDESLTRSTRLQVSVVDVLEDDHGDLPELGNATDLALNTDDLNPIPDTPGRIDRRPADQDPDVDAFAITVPVDADPQSRYVVRVSNLLGRIAPRVRVIDGDGSTVQSEFSQPDPTADFTYIVLNLDAGPGETVFVLVDNLNPNGLGTYQVGAGEILPGEVVRNAVSSVLDLRNWKLRLRRFAAPESVMAFQGTVHGNFDDFRPQVEGLIFGFNGNELVEVDPSDMRAGRGSRYAIRTQTMRGNILLNVGGTSRSRLRIASRGDYTALQGEQIVEMTMESGPVVDALEFDVDLLGPNGDRGARFNANGPRSTYLSNEFFVDSFVLRRSSRAGDRGQMRLTGRIYSVDPIGIPAEAFELDLGWTEIEVDPTDWERRGQWYQARIEAGGGEFIVRFNDARGLLSIRGRRLAIPPQDTVQELLLNVGPLNQPAVLQTRERGTGGSQTLVY